MTDKPASAIPIAVVGMSAIYPGDTGLEGFWRTITSGRDAISDVPPSHWLIADYYDPDPSKPDHTYCRRGGFIDPVPFDPMQFGLPPNALPATDSAQLLALIAAKKALDEARRGNAAVDPDRISVVLGVASTTELVVQMGARLQHPVWRKALLENGIGAEDAEAICADIGAHYAPWQESTFPGLLGNVVAGRIANRLDLGGSNYVTDAACASSLSALQVALHELYLDEADMVLTGGVDALNDIMMFMCFSKTPAFSPTGDCRPFSDAADGTIIGEGVGMLALKRLSDAERDGDRIHAVIRGLGASSDGRASSVYAPRSEGQAKALRRAYDRAGYAPSTVCLLEAHGTATKAGDVAEFAGLASVFTGQDSRCALGSVKSQIGHTKAAAGAAGLIKAVLSLQHATLPGTIKVDRPNEAVLHADAPFYVNAQTRPWVHAGDHPRRASVSSFGFGGSNFHVTLEAYEGAYGARRLRALPSELVLLSSATPEALAQRCAEVAQAAARGETLARIAHDCAQTFDASAQVRAGIVAVDVATLTAKLELVARGEADADIALGAGAPRAGRTAFLFPGQGSQYVGMGADLALAFPEALSVWDEAARAPDTAGIERVVFPEPAFDEATRAAQGAALTLMHNAQPAIAMASGAQLALLARLGVRAHAFAGHSFGEVTALSAAGVIAADSLGAIARKRGQLMTEAAGAREGAMLAVAASAQEVSDFLADHATLAAALVIANDNAPGQVVLAGATEDVAAAEKLLKEKRITAFRLPVASAFHSPIVASSCAPFAACLKGFKFAKATGAVYANATAAPYGRGVAAQLADQLRQPVRFREMIRSMADDGVTRFIEVGPGRILTGLVGQILADTPHLAVALDDRKAGGLRGWHRGLAALAADGVPLDLAALFAAYETPAAFVAPPSHAVMVGGANLGKPYPPADGNVTITPKRQRAPAVTRTLSDAPPPVVQNAAPRIEPAVSTELSGDAWGLIDRIQSETVAQHRHYLDVMAKSHQSFLDMSTQMLAQVTGAPAPSVAATPVHFAPVAVQTTPSVAPAQPPSIVVPAPESFVTPAAAANAPQRATPEELVLTIVSEKTGYPGDMLKLDMEMEAELGIDSIKQVEILSALQAHYPGAPDIAASELAALKTLRDVAMKIGTLAGAAVIDAAPTVSAPVLLGEAPRALDPAALQASVLAIVAEKTGYPVDMLGLDMEMEAELGIDSIKQVEILSALQDRWPDAPDVAPSELAGLKTLSDVARALTQMTGGGAEARPSREFVAQTATTGALTVAAPVRVAAPAAGFAMAGLRDGDGILVCGGERAFATAVVKAFKAKGLQARVGAASESAGAVLSLSAMRTADNAADARAIHLDVLRQAQAVARSNAPTRVFIAAQAPPAMGQMPSGVSGIVRTAAREWENGVVKSVELDGADAVALVEEILGGGGDCEVVLMANGARFVVRDAPHSARDVTSVTPTRGGVLLVSGGRGVTATCAIALAARHGLKVAFLGRTDIAALDATQSAKTTEPEIIAELMAKARAEGETLTPGGARAAAAQILSRRDIQATLEAARRRGVEAHYFAADVCDAARVAAVAKEARTHLGAIIGVIHGAGVLADKRIGDLEAAQFARVFDAKVAGVEALLAATQEDRLEIIALFSSVAARTGNAGQAAYAAANVVLNCVAVREAARRGESCAVRAFGWGPWDGGMVDASLKRHFERAGVGVLAIEEGARFFADEAVRKDAPVIVAAAPAAEARLPVRVEWIVSPERLPALHDHMVQGRIVLPVAVVLERILRGARALSPLEGALLHLRDLQVLSGVTMGVDDAPVSLGVTFEPREEGYAVTVRDAALRPRYRAMVTWAPDAPEIDFSARHGAPWRMSAAEAYEGPLFHGPQFSALTSLEADGIAQLRSLDALGWPADAWAFDPAALDGGLQLGLVWAHGEGRPLMLPQKIASFVQHASYTPGAALRCRLKASPVNDKRADFDLRFETLDGAVVAELRGVEFYAIAAVSSAAP